MTTRNKLKNIEKSLKMSAKKDYDRLVMHIIRLGYGFIEPLTEKDKITHREWEWFKERSLKLALERGEENKEKEILLSMENTIKEIGGFLDEVQIC
jgi:hypothetical protein